MYSSHLFCLYLVETTLYLYSKFLLEFSSSNMIIFIKFNAFSYGLIWMKKKVKQFGNIKIKLSQ